MMRDYENFKAKEISENTGRTVNGIYSFASSMGFSRKAWTTTDVKKMKEIAGSTPLKDMAVFFQRSESAVANKCNREGITYLRMRRAA